MEKIITFRFFLIIKNGLKQGDALSSLLLNLILRFIVRKIQENKRLIVLFQFSELNQILAYANNVNLLGVNKNEMHHDTKILIGQKRR